MNDLSRLEAAFTLLEELAPTELESPSDRTPPSRRRRYVAIGAAVAAVLLSVSTATWVEVQRHTSAAGVPGGFRYSQPTDPGQVIPVADRRRAGEISVPALPVPSPVLRAGRVRGPFRLSNSAGQVVVINYWASWCPPCRTDLTVLSRLAAATNHLGVTVVGIATRDTRAAATSAVGFENPRGFSFYFDGSGRTAEQLGDIPDAALPVTVIVDRRGRIAAVYQGATPLPGLLSAVDTVATGR